MTSPRRWGGMLLVVVFTACSSGIPASSVVARSSIELRSRPRGSSAPRAASPCASGKPDRVKRGDLARELGRVGSGQATARTVSVRLSPTSRRPPRRNARRLRVALLERQADSAG